MADTPINETLGVDFSCVDDIDANLTIVSGPQCLGQAVARRIGTPRFGLFYDADYGTDIRSRINAVPSQRVASQLVEIESLKDERVEDCRATVRYVPASNVPAGEVPESLQVEVALKTALGPFTMTLAIDAVTAAIVSID
jgi:hypothetical protein